MRILLCFLLLLATAMPHAAFAAATTCDDPTSSSALDLIEQAYNDLTLLYYEPFQPAKVLTPARDAAEKALGITAADTDDVSDWMVFQDEFCASWADTSGDFSADTVAYPSITAMYDTMQEPHTQFYTPEEYQEEEQAEAGDVHYQGIGASMSGDPLTVQRVFPDSPAEKAGLRLGDRIVAIDGQPSADMSPSDAAKLIRGEEGTSVHLTIERPGVAGQRDLDIVRAAIHIPLIETRMEGNIAYLRIEDFSSGDLPKQVKAALESFLQQGAKGLILDLRGNPGGRLDVGTKIAGYFLPPGAPVYQETLERGETVTATTSGDRIWDGPVDVLIDGETASMGELLAAALHEEDNALLIGSQSAGAVAGSVILPLKDGSAVQVTIELIDSAKGTVLNNVGITPDMPVEATPDSTGAVVDSPLNAAMADMRTKVGAPSPTATAPATAPTRAPATTPTVHP